MRKPPSMLTSFLTIDNCVKEDDIILSLVVCFVVQNAKTSKHLDCMAMSFYKDDF